MSATEALMEHSYHADTETGRMIMIALQSLLMEAGILAHLLTNPTPLLVYTEPCWISATRDFMAANQLSLQFTKSWNFRLARDHDRPVNVCALVHEQQRLNTGGLIYLDPSYLNIPLRLQNHCQKSRQNA
jgi:hypothetical protein